MRNRTPITMAKPNPVRSETISDWCKAGEVRRLTCRQYNACLTIALKQRWDGFACNRCSVDDCLSREEQRFEFDGLANVLANISS
jgi:hypothetical protein